MKILWNIISLLCVAFTSFCFIVAGMKVLASKREGKELLSIELPVEQKGPPRVVSLDEVEAANLQFIKDQRKNKKDDLCGKPSAWSKAVFKRLEPFLLRKSQEICFEDTTPEEIWQELIREFTDEELFVINSSKGFLNSTEGILLLRIPIWLRAIQEYSDEERDDGVIDYRSEPEEIAHIAVILSIMCGLELWRRADPGTGVVIPDDPFDPDCDVSYKREPSIERLETYLGPIMESHGKNTA